MSFISEIREEALMSLEKKRCCQLAELLGITLFSEAVSGGEWTLRTDHEGLIKHTSILIRRAFGLRDSVINEEKRLYIDNPGDTLAILSDLSLLGRVEAAESLLGDLCCKRAFVRGAFLVSGTVSDPMREYRLQFTVPGSSTLCRMLCEALEAYQLSPKITMRGERYIIYFKSSEDMGDVLKMLGAGKSAIELLNAKILKQRKNQINRAMNCEMANLDKTLASAETHLSAIRKIRERGKFSALPEKLKEMAIAREEHPDASIAELGRILGISKPAANNRLKKLMEFAE